MNEQPLEQTEPPHWQRVRDERWQLFERIIKLRSFLGGKASLSISSEHLSLLRLQLAIMKQYEGMLGALDITTEMRPVYRAGKRGFLTKDAAIGVAIKGIARKLDQCFCDGGDGVTPPHYCGCQDRIAEMIDVLTPIAKRLPDSQAEWEEKTSDDFWASYEFGKEEEVVT